MNDPRRTPARGDVAAAHLQGQVEAARFADGTPTQVQDGVCALRAAPSLSARLETQMLRGELFTVYDISADGWAWGQAVLDSYVGYARREALSPDVIPTTHRVVGVRTIMFPYPDLKAQPHGYVPMNAKVAIAAVNDGFVRLVRGGWCPADQIVPLTHKVDDWVASAESLIGAPYLWGGKDGLGADCSGLLQSALETGGLAAPRDADMQEAELGEPIAFAPEALRRGDLLFWDGHVAIARNGVELLHANGFHMRTLIEPLASALARIGEPRTVKRLKP